LAPTCSGQVSALYNMMGRNYIFIKKIQVFKPIHTHCKYKKLIFMYPLRHMCFIRRRIYSAWHLLQDQQLYRRVQQTNYPSKSDYNFKTTVTSAEGITILRR
jgi:hypothetical protein